jgi:hypothetical protein
VGGDTFNGGGGDDRISGADGEDKIDGGPGADRLTGGDDPDTFTCDGADTLVDFVPGEIESGCFPVVDPPPAREPDPVAPVEPGAPGAPSAPATPSKLGFARPRVVATRTGLKVVVRSTAAQPITVALRATERRGRKLHRYRGVRKTIPAGRRVAVKLKAPRALLRQIRAARGGKRRAAVTVTNVATGAKLTARR